MDPPRKLEPDPWDVDRLRLTADLTEVPKAVQRPPRHRPGESFLKGPIPYSWIAAACRLPGSGLHIASACRYLCDRYRGRNRWGLEAIATELRLSLDTARRGLHAAELAGLVSVDREPGCKLSISILDLATCNPRLRPLYGPIPWGWWLAALHLGGPAVKVATACWIAAGWGRSAEIELPLAGWADLGLSRCAAGRGVKCLRGAGLIDVVERTGRSPLVTLLDGPTIGARSNKCAIGANPEV